LGKSKWLKYGAIFDVKNKNSEPYSGAFVECYGNWDDDNPTWNRTGSNGRIAIGATLCEENYPRKPKKIKADCVIKDGFEQRPIQKEVLFYPRQGYTYKRVYPIYTNW